MILPQMQMPQVKVQEVTSVLQNVEGELLKAGSISVSENSQTQGQPFAKGTAGSNLFRIPCLITLKNGSILTAADARYTEYRDFGGIDTNCFCIVRWRKNMELQFSNLFPRQ